MQNKFRNISRVMDCVGCDKCRLWGKLQVTGLGTALKILFWTDNATKDNNSSSGGGGAAEEKKTPEELEAMAEELQTLQPPKDELLGSAFR
jgi:hypothetical protein